MWPWFLGLVYESVTSEMSRNENKWLLLASDSLVCVEMSSAVVLMHSFRLWPKAYLFSGGFQMVSAIFRRIAVKQSLDCSV